MGRFVVFVVLLFGALTEAAAQPYYRLVAEAPAILTASQREAGEALASWKASPRLAVGEVPSFRPVGWSFNQVNNQHTRTYVIGGVLRGAVMQPYRDDYVFVPTPPQRDRLHMVMRSKFPPVCRIGESRMSVDMSIVTPTASGSIISEAIGHLEYRWLNDGPESPNNFGMALGRYPALMLAVGCETFVDRGTPVAGGVIPTHLRHEVRYLFWSVVGRFDVNFGRSFGFYDLNKRQWYDTTNANSVGLYAANLRDWRNYSGYGRDFLYMSRWSVETLRYPTQFVTTLPNIATVRYSRDAVIRISDGNVLNQRTLQTW